MILNYDLRIAPNTFDFATFLANAFMYSRLTGGGLELINIYTTGYRSDKSWGNIEVPEAYHQIKIDSVILPLVRLLKDKPSFSIINNMNYSRIPQTGEKTFPPDFRPESLPREFRSESSLLPCSENVLNKLFQRANITPHPFIPDPHLQESVFARWGPRYVTFTVRNSGLNSNRNGGEQLIKFLRKPLALELNRCGFKFVIIPDRENIDPGHPLNDFYGQDVDLEAAFCLRRRYALYSMANMNISPATGPNILLAFSEYPYYIFDNYDENVLVMQKNFFDRKGPSFNKQRPWATKSQYMDWTARSFENYPILVTKILKHTVDSAVVQSDRITFN